MRAERSLVADSGCRFGWASAPHGKFISWVGSVSPPMIIAFRTHGPHMRIDDLYAPSGRFVVRVSASVATVDRCPGRGRALPAADNDSLRSSPYPPRSARAPQKPLLPRRPSLSRLLQGVLHRGLTRSRPRARPRPPLPRLALRRPDDEAVLGPHLQPESSAYSNSSWCCTPCCRLWLWARRGPSTICQAS